MNDTPPPFRLLAITPPSGAVDAQLVAHWRAAAGGVPMGLLLRDPEPDAALEPSGRLAAVASRAARDGVVTVWSADIATVLRRRSLPPWTGGVQLRGDPSQDAIARLRDHLQVVAPHAGRVLGRSVHNAPSACPGVTYSVFAPVFSPRTTTPGRSPKNPVGLAALRRWTQACPDVFALGGVDLHTAAQCIAAGATGLASIHAFFGAPSRVTLEVAAFADAVTQP